MKTNIEAMMIVIFLISAGFIAGITVSNNNIVLTENMEDCQEKKGKYVLSIKPNGNIYYEKCNIEESISY